MKTEYPKYYFVKPPKTAREIFAIYVIKLETENDENAAIYRYKLGNYTLKPTTEKFYKLYKKGINKYFPVYIKIVDEYFGLNLSPENKS